LPYFVFRLSDSFRFWKWRIPMLSLSSRKSLPVVACRLVRCVLPLLVCLGLFASAPGFLRAQTLDKVIPLWNESMGNPAFFAARFNSQLRLNGDINGVNFSGYARAECTAFRLNKELLHASGDINAATAGNLSAQVKVRVLGNTVYNPRWSGSFLFNVGDTLNYPYDFQTPSVTFTVGPVPVTIRGGLRGNVGLRYAASYEPGDARSTLEPRFSCSAYASGSVNLWAVEAGVRISLYLLDGQVPFNARAFLSPNYQLPTPKWGVQWNYHAAYDARTLNGDLSLFARVRYPCFRRWRPRWCWREYSTPIFSWPGRHLTGTIASDSGWYDLGLGAPTLGEVTPSVLRAGGAGTTLTLNGANFAVGSTVYWNDTPLSTVWVSASRLTAAVPESLVRTPNSPRITVVNTLPLRHSTNGITVQALYPPPSLRRILPGSVIAGDSGFALTAQGVDFVQGATINWNGTALPTTFVSATRLTATVSPDRISRPGPVLVTVANPSPGGGTSDPLVLPVLVGTPSLSSISPYRVWPGDPAFTMTVDGARFVPGSKVRWSGTPLATTYVSGAQLQAHIPANLLTQERRVQITVVNPRDRGVDGAPSNALPFLIAPRRYTVEPLYAPNGAQIYADDVNDLGQVAGYYIPEDFVYQPFLWQQEEMFDLPSSMFPSGINGWGQVAGDDLIDGSLVGYLWTPEQQGSHTGTLLNLSTATEPRFSWTCAINELGQVAGASDRNGNRIASVWSPHVSHGMTGSVTQLPLLNGGVISLAEAINDRGQVAGRAHTGVINGLYIEHAVLWQNNQIYDLGLLGGEYSFATAINNSGKIVGRSDTNITFNNRLVDHPFLWTPTVPNGTQGTMIDLFPSTSGNGWANDINDEGLVVGLHLEPDWFAFLYDGRLRNLDDCLPPGSGYSTVNASGINNRGQIIAEVRGNGAYYALLTPVELGFDDEPATPILQSVSPASAAAGQNGFTLLLRGADFKEGALVYWNGTILPTTFVSGKLLKAEVAANLVTEAGTASVVVVNPAPGGSSDALPLEIRHPQPRFDRLTPNQTTAGSGDLIVTLEGTQFHRNAVVHCNGVPLKTFFLSPTRLRALVDASKMRTPGTASFTVVNPTPGGGASAAQMLRIVAPQYWLWQLTPDNAPAGSSSVSLVVTGMGFTPDCVVYWDDTPLATQYTTSQRLTATVPAGLLNQAALAAISVQQGTSGRVRSNTRDFAVLNPVAQITRVSPGSLQANCPAFVLTVEGTGFQPRSMVYWNGSPLELTGISPTQITARVTASDIPDQQEIAQIVVKTPAPGGGDSNTVELPFTDPPQLGALLPDAVRAGNGAFTLTAEGENFASGTVLYWNQTPLVTTRVSDNRLDGVVPAALINAQGTALISAGIPGQGRSAAIPLSIVGATLPTPRLTAMTPAEARVGDAEIVLILKGSGFVSSTKVIWDGQELRAGLLSGEMMAVVISETELTVARTVSVRVETPNGGTSNTLSFIVR
jgi:probable HAF family extracellular repeat protein